ncbi:MULTISPECIES: hypothetical protein [unclassified Thermoactinomyces]|jgi:nitrogen fixation-related uncharacterized protein|uniref:hypothetical protein n=1 Tax=unclassified Thermoactinomyces TaxID=2634588 RepID=UPI0018DC9501|nr:MULTISPECIES: hypothetical protein [unclassified Thermoactinomyces]MBH8604110.1 hypothetical protein [Thermoactinomyces sp. CICC 10522]MBH8608678.1 hypothetical protein [Thermoactinomyces sp. CICC 10521]
MNKFVLHIIGVALITIGLIGVIVFWGFGSRINKKYEDSHDLPLLVSFLLDVFFGGYNFIGIGLLFFLFGIVMGVIVYFE